MVRKFSVDLPVFYSPLFKEENFRTWCSIRVQKESQEDKLYTESELSSGPLIAINWKAP